MPIRRDSRCVIKAPLLLNTMVPRSMFQRAMRAGCRCAHWCVDRMPRVEPKGFPTEKEKKEEQGLMVALKDVLRAESDGPI